MSEHVKKRLNAAGESGAEQELPDVRVKIFICAQTDFINEVKRLVAPYC